MREQFSQSREAILWLSWRVIIIKLKFSTKRDKFNGKSVYADDIDRFFLEYLNAIIT